MVMENRGVTRRDKDWIGVLFLFKTNTVVLCTFVYWRKFDDRFCSNYNKNIIFDFFVNITDSTVFITLITWRKSRVWPTFFQTG